MDERTEIYLRWIGLQANALIDGGETCTLDDVHTHAKERTIIEWLSELGCDMSILLHDDVSAQMKQTKSNVDEILGRVASSLQGREHQKLGVENNGFCFIVGLVFEALAIGD